MKRFLLFAFLLFGSLLFCENKILAYEQLCSGEELFSNGNKYKVCNKQVYFDKDNRDNSSYILGDRGYSYSAGKILYAGKIDGYETFYSIGFHYYGIVYDDGIFSDKDMYSDMSFHGLITYSGKFEDNILVDQSGRYLINYFNEPGEYVFRQFIGGKVVSVIKVFVVDKKDLDLGVDKVYYDEVEINSSGVMYSDGGTLRISFNGGKHGFGNLVKVQVNKCEFKKQFNPELLIDSDDLDGCIRYNDYNDLTIFLYDGLGRMKSISRKFKINSTDIVVSLEDSVSKLVTSSRRVLVKSTPGYGGNLDENYNLYYWSTSAIDKLTYEDFMSNYEASDNKGVYSSNNGIILRDSKGSYYLYVLAKDDLGNCLVVRSKEYVLEKHKALNKATIGDVVLTLVLCLCAAMPIFIYLIIRGKDSF